MEEINVFCFLFYPGDYLRDTQCLSEKSQVAYDRIMCEHVRNLVISHEKISFFTKKLNADEREELMQVLKKIEGGFCINWVVDQVVKRKEYCQGRGKNKSGKTKKINKKTSKKTTKSYDSHMEIEIEEEKEKDFKMVIEQLFTYIGHDRFQKHWDLWKQFRKQQWKKEYKIIGETMAKTRLLNLADQDEEMACRIIVQSMSKPWMDFYKIKEESYANNNNNQRTGGKSNIVEHREPGQYGWERK